MKNIKRFMTAALVTGMLFAAKQAVADSTTMLPITWRGDKWEYLVEYPRGTNYIDPVRFEELLDDAGQHGWELVSVSHESHFYAFYFKRPLYPHKIAAHRAHLAKVKAERAQKEKIAMDQIQAAYKEKIMLEKAYSQQVAKVDQELKQEVKLNQELAQEVKVENHELQQKAALETRTDMKVKQENQDLLKEVQLAKQADQALELEKRLAKQPLVQNKVTK